MIRIPNRKDATEPTAKANTARNGLAAVFVCLLALQANACPVCFPVPVKSAVDYLLECEFAVLAREDPKNPFSYAAVDDLKGNFTTSKFGLFVNSPTRRHLKLNPDSRVLLVRASEAQSWRSLGIADRDFQRVIRRVLLFADEWKRQDGQQKRVEFFLPFLGHKNRDLFELAYLEVGKAPYGVIKKMAQFVSREDLRPMLHQREYIEWAPLAILLTAQEATKQDRRLIEDSFRRCARFSHTQNLAAWTTAFIELNGLKAIEEIEEKYLKNPNRSRTEVNAMIVALSVHGGESQANLRDRVAKSYGVALIQHPFVAARVAVDLTNWKNWHYRKAIAKIATSSKVKFDPAETKAIKSYLE